MRGGNFGHICMHLMWQLLHWKLTDKVISLVQQIPILLKAYYEVLHWIIQG
jgi:Co/Zn/Cd efflux system component